MILKFIIILLIYASVFAIGEFLLKKKIKTEVTRKIIHMGGGLISLLLPSMVGIFGAVILTVLFSSILLVSKKKMLFESIHYSHRYSLGEILFPIGILFPFILFIPGNEIFYYGAILVLTFSDGLAGLFGSIFGRKKYSITGEKTWLGSMFFFLSTLVIYTIIFVQLGIYFYMFNILLLLLASLTITIIEGIFGRGWDNLFIPICSGTIIFFITNFM